MKYLRLLRRVETVTVATHEEIVKRLQAARDREADEADELLRQLDQERATVNNLVAEIQALKPDAELWRTARAKRRDGERERRRIATAEREGIPN